MKSLIKQQKSLQKQLNAVTEEIEAMVIAKHYPSIKKKFEGKYFKLSNGYNSDERWWMFIKVTKIDPKDVYDTNGNGITSRYSGFSFETTTSKTIDIEMNRTGYVHSLEVEITEDEFYLEWSKMIDRLTKLRKL